jgi:hypothetical protein
MEHNAASWCTEAIPTLDAVIRAHAENPIEWYGLVLGNVALHSDVGEDRTNEVSRGG